MTCMNPAISVVIAYTNHNKYIKALFYNEKEHWAPATLDKSDI